MGPLPSLDNINLILFEYINNFLYICNMKKLFQYIIIRLTTRHASTAADIYESIFGSPTPPPVIIFSTKYNNVTPPKSPTNGLSPESIPDKKQEIKVALKYLKRKPIKSKQDKGSISMLEGVLATMT